MTTCNKCGEEIEFRYVDGRSTPIHLGGWCRGSQRQETLGTRFGEISSYLNPNATCPACKKAVYFYQSPHGGRVYFDDVGWPWPKHECTYFSSGQRGNVVAENKRSECITDGSFFYDKMGRIRRLLLLAHVEGISENYVFHFQSPVTGAYFLLQYSRSGIDRAGLRVHDIREAPSFVVDDTEVSTKSMQIDFICGRLKKIVKIRMNLVDRK